jgi:hypothetical protein
MMGNVIQSAWEGVASVKDAVELLEAFDSLAKRPTMARDVRNKARTPHTPLITRAHPSPLCIATHRIASVLCCVVLCCVVLC